jgi:dipeptidase E
MKLYLSSYRLGNEPQKLAELFSDNKNIAVIGNAMDFVDDLTRKEKIEDSFAELKNIGLIPEEIDLRNYFEKQNELNKKLNNFGAVYVRGGNSFILRRAMSESGFDKIIKEKNNDLNFIYAGYSAGICVLSPTLQGIEFVDDPNIVPKGYKAEIIWDGLNIINDILVPHYRSDHPESAMVEKEAEYYTKNKINFTTLRDGEVIIKS